MSNLRELRRRIGLTQADVAVRSGLRQATISALENGRARPHSGTLLALSRALEVEVEEVRRAIGESTLDGGAVETLGGDWGFLEGMDADLRSGLVRSLVAEWTHSSTALEGNTISVGDTLFVLAEGLTVSGKSLREHQELHGHAQALGLMASWVRAGRQVRVEELHQMHRAVQTGVVVDSLAPVGSWKVEPNGTTAIKSSGGTQWHEYARPLEVAALVMVWLRGLSKVLRELRARRGGDGPDPSVVIDAYTDAHLGFVGIHPYAGGNGRMARLLANIPVLRGGLPPLLVPLAERRRYLVLLGDYSIARGQPRPGEELVFGGKEREALRGFFEECWGGTLEMVGEYRRRQESRGIRE